MTTSPSPRAHPRAVLFDRDGTLVVDVPYNADPALVRAMPTAVETVGRLRAAGIAVGVVTNQSAIGLGRATRDEVDSVNAAVDGLLGPFDDWQVCPHTAEERCGCRKPRPGMILAAARALGVNPRDVAVIGDIGADVAAARAAGARSVLVPTAVTRPEEVAAAPLVAATVADAVTLLVAGHPTLGRRPRRALVARLDSVGDVLLAGPAVRAIAESVDEVWFLASPEGQSAARLLPGVDRVLVWSCPWITASTPDATPEGIAEVNALLAEADPDLAVILTSFHQSPLPLALLLRLAGVAAITGASVDFAGSLLDTRLRPGEDLPEDQPEPLRALAIAAAAGFALPPGDDGLLAVVTPPDMTALTGSEPYIVVHPGASVPAREWPAGHHAETVRLLTEAGWRVIVTGTPAEADLTARVAGQSGVDLGGATDLAGLSGVLARAAVVITGNTGPAHLAAAVGTPVVSLFSPVVPAVRWAPYGVPVRLLGDQHAPCRDSRARECPVAGHPCLSVVSPEQVVAACFDLAGMEAVA